MTQYSGVFTLQQQGQALTSGQWCTDPYYKNTTLLLHADNVSGSAQNNTFVDSSTNGFAITRNGNTTQGSFTPYGPTWSNYFDGSSYLSASASAGLSGSGNFTLEAWVFPTIVSGQDNCIYETRGGSGWVLFLTSSAYLQVFDSVGLLQTASSSTVPLNQWSHVALVKNGSTCTYYINGTASGTFTLSSFASASGVRIGTRYDASQYFRGYISNLRTVTSAVYTSAFTPSTTPLTAITNTSLLTCQSNRFIDNSTNAFAITVNGTPSVQRFSPFAPQYQYTPDVIGGSGYFDGSGDYLSNNGASGAFAFGTGAFTIEFWMYASSATARQGLYTNNTASVGTGPVFAIAGGGTTGVIGLGNVGYADSVQTGSNAFSANAWHHVALVREGTGSNQTKIYVDGVQKAAGTYADNLSTSREINIGATYNYGEYFGGYISNLRVVKGTAVYTTAFTPPTTPLTAISGTSLLLNFTNGGIYDNAMMNDLETVGNAQVSTNVVKYGSGSLAFDGSGDYLLVPMTSTIGIPASSPFTYECWIYLTAAQANYRMLSSDSGGTTTYIAINSTGLEAQFGGLSSTLASCTYSFSTGTWYHLALVRNSSNAVVFYVNGVAQTMTNGTQSNAFLYQGSSLYIGRWVGATPYEWYGYIDDLRITKGVARYTANFQPPKVAFANQ